MDSAIADCIKLIGKNTAAAVRNRVAIHHFKSGWSSEYYMPFHDLLGSKKRFVCRVCGKSSIFPSEITHHLKNNHGISFKGLNNNYYSICYGRKLLEAIFYSKEKFYYDDYLGKRKKREVVSEGVGGKKKSKKA